MSEIGSLVVTLEANMAKYASDMDRAASLANQRMGEINSAVDTVKSAFEALGIAIGVGAFVDLIKGSMEASEKLANLSISTHLSVETLAGLSLLAKESGTDMDTLAKGINRMSVEIGKSPDAFKALGITATDSAQAFGQFADIFKQLPDINQRNALAQAVFSRSWAELAPIMVMGNAQIQEAITKGTMLSGQNDATAKSAREFSDKWIELTGTGGIATRMMQGMLPALADIADQLLGVQQDSLDASNGFIYIGQTIGEGLLTVRDFTVLLWEHRQAIEALAGVYASWKIASFVADLADAAVKTYLNVSATLAAKDAVVQKASADVAATAASAALTAARVAELRVAVLAAEGEVALAIVTNGLVPAQAAAAAAAAAHTAAQAALVTAEYEASIASGVLNVALTTLGGPLAILITLVGAAATAWLVFGNNGKSALQGIKDEVDKGIAIAQRYAKDLKFGTGDVGQLTASLDAVNQRISLLATSSGPGAAKALKEARDQAAALELALERAGKAQSALAVPTTGKTPAQIAAERAAKDFLDGLNGGGDTAKIKLSARMLASEAEIAQAKASMQEQEKLLQGFYGDQYIDATTYYADRRLVIQNALDAERQLYELQYADVNVYLATSKDKEKAQKATADKSAIASAAAKTEADAQRALNTVLDEQTRIYRTFELVTAAVAHGQQLSANQAAFELDMIGRTADEVAQLTAARTIELAVEERLYQARRQNIPQALSQAAQAAAAAQEDAARAIAKAKQDALLQYNFSTGTVDVAHNADLGDRAAQFRLDMLGKNTLAIAQQNAARTIELALEARLYELQKLQQSLDPATLAQAVLAAEKQKAAAIARVTAEYDKQRSAQFGVSEAFRKYSEDASNTAAQMEALFTKTFKGMEDGLVEFVRTGKLDFASLADSIISDLIRIMVQQSITGPLAAAFSSGGGSVVTSFLSMLGFAGGGDPPVGRASLVGEVGPELFVPHSAGTIIPNSKLGGGSDIVVNIIESPGNGGQTARRSSGGVDYLDVFVEKVKNSLAGDITRGSGVVPNAMASTYGLNRVAGVY